MDKRSYLIIVLFSGLAIFSFWFYQKRSYEQQQTAQLWEEYKQHFQSDKVTQKAPVLKTEEEAYQRPQIKRPLYKEEIARMSWDILDERKIKMIAAEIKSRSQSERGDFNFEDEPVWDIHQLPSSEHEYKLWLNELKIVSLNHLVDHALKDNFSEVRLAMASYVSLSILTTLQFKGYDEGENLLLQLPDNFVSLNQQRYKNYAKIQKNKRKVANTEEVVEGDEKFSLDALFQEKLEQTPYFSDMENPSKKSDKYWGGEKNLFDGVSEALDYMVNAISNLDVFYTPPKGVHASNLEVINETIRDANLRPEEYNLRAGTKISDATDLDFEILAEGVVRKVALHHGLLGSSFTTVLGRTLVDKIQNARVFAAGVLLTVGVESVFAALGCYWGNIRLIMLHRYHAYIKDAKSFYKRNNRDFVLGEVPPFDPEHVYYSETTRIEINKSWVWGFVLGSAVNRFLTKEVWTKIGTSIALWSFENIVSSNIFIRGTAKVLSAAALGMITSLGELFARVATLPLASVKWAGKVIGFFKHAFSVTPAVIAAYILDFTFTAAAIYAVIHTKLYASMIMFDRIYYAPEMTIYLTQQDWYEDDQLTGAKAFLDSTRKHFYPLCHYMATHDLGGQQMTNYSQESSTEGTISQIYRQQKNNCMRIMAGFEGVEEEELHQHFKNLINSNELEPLVYDLYFTDKAIEEKDVADYLVQMHTSYPEFYKIIWVAGLKSIYQTNHLPEGFYAYKNLIISGKGGDLFEEFNSYFDFSVNKQAERVNTIRFEYIIEKLAHRAKKAKVEAGIGDQGDPLDLTEAFVVYWKYHSSRTREFNREVYELLREEDKGFFELLWDGVVSAYNNIEWLVRRWMAKPYELTHNYQVEKQIDHIMETQKQDCWFGFWCTSK